MDFDAVYYEPASLTFELGKQLKEQFYDLPWIPIENHNSIEEMREKENSEFSKMKRNLIVGTRKTHKYVENHKVTTIMYAKVYEEYSKAFNIRNKKYKRAAATMARLEAKMLEK